MKCRCGHVDDEHGVDDDLLAECTIDDCLCVHFDWNGEDS